MWMTFFNRHGTVSRSEPLDSFDAALDAARRGPSGARFAVTFLAADPENDCQHLEGFVA